MLLATYDFVNANKLFGYNLVVSIPEKRNEESPFSSFLSLTSYLLQHAYRSERVATYAELNMFSLRILIEDPVLCKRICSDESKRNVRLCRQRQPHLPLVNGDRVLATVIFDMMIDTITHNLRRRLDISLYRYEVFVFCFLILEYFPLLEAKKNMETIIMTAHSNTIAILIRLCTYLSSNKTRLTYHWSEMWRTLLSLMRFLTTYASDLSSSPNIDILTNSLVDLIAFTLSTGDTFLPDPASYDDLFYKIVEGGPIISRFRTVYKLPTPSESRNAPSAVPQSSSIDTLITVSTHFVTLLFQTDKPSTKSEDAPAATRKRNLSPREVHQIIKQGYDTLSIQPQEGLSTWEKWREADRKLELKRAARYAVTDSRKLVAL